MFMSLETSQAFLSSPSNHWIHVPARLYAEKPKKHKTIHRPPYRLGGQPYLEHRQRKDVKNAISKVHGPAQEVLELQKTTNATVHNATTNQTTVSESAISNTNATTMVNDSLTTNLLPLTTTTNTSTLQKNKSKSSKAQDNYFSTWAIDMTKKPKEKPKTVETLLSNKRGDELLTVADLEEILSAGGYVRESDLLSGGSPSNHNVRLKNSGSVAIPQVSVLSYRGLTIGSTVASGLLGMILSITILPNLWLVGILLGSLYGYQVSKDYKDKPPTTDVFSRIVVGMGRRLAKAYLVVYDFFHGIWFMYKTGQLSYEYYKQYSKLDDRFGIGEKIDAWNARFIEGKKKFDQWEKENEVSRRLLATLRTAWLVEEQSLKKGRRKQSKYRIVQYVYDVTGWCGRFLTATWDAITGGGSSDLREILKGIRINISESRWQEIGPRTGAAMLALVTVSLIGAMFAIAPKVLGFLAIATGVIWPTWVPEFLERFKSLLDEFKAKGRGEEFQGESGNPTALSQFGIYDKKRYYYYRRKDGSKRWYRTGRPAFRSDEEKGDGGLLGDIGLLGGTKDKAKTGKAGKKTKTTGKQQWGLFG